MLFIIIILFIIIFCSESINMTVQCSLFVCSFDIMWLYDEVVVSAHKINDLFITGGLNSLVVRAST